MANIPGMYGTIPWSDPSIIMTFEKPGGKLVTDDWGDKFEIEGDIRLIALDILEYALVFKKLGYGGLSFSKFTFRFADGNIEVTPRCVENNPEKAREITDLVEAIKKVIALKAFL